MNLKVKTELEIKVMGSQVKNSISPLSEKERGIIRMVWENYSFNHIAKELKTSKCFINKTLNKYGLKTKKILMLEEGLHLCKKCNLYKTLEKFKKRKTKNLIVLNSFCNPCHKYPESMKRWYEENKIKIQDVRKKWRKNNKDKIREYGKQYYNEIKKDTDKRLKQKVKSAMSNSVRFNKSNQYLNMVGYTVQDLKEHLESKFREGMSWDNYGRGGWHIDHIRPLASFDLTQELEFIRAWGLYNLQPLWESENCSKGSLYNGVRYQVKSKH